MNTQTEIVGLSPPPASDSSTHERPQTFVQRIYVDSRFNCQNQGHWPRYVPYKTHKKSKPSSARYDPTINSSDFPELQCPCGGGACIILTSKTKKNPGRKFYTCPIQDSGEGACNFFQWQDTRGKTTINGHEVESKRFISPQSTLKKRAHSDMVEDGELSCKRLKRMEFEYPVIKNPQHFPNFVALSGPFERNKVLLIESRDRGEQSDVSSLKHYNPLKDGSCFQILGLDVLGWLGRLAFPPSRDLTFPPPKPQDVDVFNIEGSTILPQSRSVVKFDKSNKLSLLTPVQDAQVSSGVFCEPSGLKSPPNMVQGSIITRSILEAFGHAAVRVQNDLLTLLELMDPLDHESMVKEANSAFYALDCLSVDYRPFYERVREFIGCASSLAVIEWSISNDISSQELVDQYNCAKLCFDDLSHNHAKAMVAFTASDERLRLLREEASHVKSMLFQIENKLSSCEAETMDLETHLVQISEEMSETKQSLLAASQEASKVWKLRQQREVERRVAKAALEKARVQLRK